MKVFKVNAQTGVMVPANWDETDSSPKVVTPSDASSNVGIAIPDKDTKVVDGVLEEFLVKLKVNKRDYRLYYLPQVANRTHFLVSCAGKSLADELNSMFGANHPDEVDFFIKRSKSYKFCIIDKLMYLMQDNSKLVWIDEMNQWGYMYCSDQPWRPKVVSYKATPPHRQE